MLDEIGSDRDLFDPLVQLALRLIPPAAPTEAGARILGPRIREWAGWIGGADTLHRAQIEGLQEVSAAAPQLIADHAQAQDLLNRIRDHINNTGQGEEPLRALAAFPWPDAQVQSALTTVRDFWDQMPQDARLPALKIVRNVSDDFKHLVWAHNQITNDVQSDPRGEASKLAAAEAHRMGSDIRARVFGSAVGSHEAVTAEWGSLDPDAAAEVIVGCRDTGAATISRLFDAIAAENRPSAAADALGAMAATGDSPEDAVQASAGYCDTLGLAQAAETATAVLVENGTAAASALRS